MTERTFRFTTDQGHPIDVVIQPETVHARSARSYGPRARINVGGWGTHAPLSSGMANQMIDKMLSLGAVEITDG